MRLALSRRTHSMTPTLSTALLLVAALPAAPAIEVFFSPPGGCTEAIVREIESARESVHVQAYVFTARPIADALIDARKRGVQVRVIVDKSNQTDRMSVARLLRRAGVEVLLDGEHAVANNKVVIVDESVVLTGSFNFTRAAEDANAENLLLIRGHSDVARKFMQNWERHREHSALLRGGSAPRDESRAAPSSGGGTPGPAAQGRPPATDDARVYITRSGQRYHRKDCATLRGGGSEVTLAEARKQGRTPCRVCKPQE
jgi:phosphatidylserine/phosphatidylglycerophosphate/cardiolipin synthase-like enzyme